MKLSVSKKTGFKLYNNLLSQHENSQHYLEHKQDHPADILNQAIKQVLQEFLLFKQSIHIPVTVVNEQIAIALFAYVSALNDFYDTMLLIIKLLSPVSDNINDNTEEWLKENNLEQYNDFLSTVEDTHKLIKLIMNKLEHDPSNKVGYLILSNHKEIPIKGFYIKKIVDGKALFLPNQEIHKHYCGGDTAFSYNYFIRYTAGFIAQCIYHLNRVLFQTNQPKPQIPPNDIIEFFESCAKISDVLLPNEYHLKNTSITSKGSIIIQFPSKISVPIKNDEFHSLDTLKVVDKSLPMSKSLFPYFQLIIEK